MVGDAGGTVKDAAQIAASYAAEGHPLCLLVLDDKFVIVAADSRIAEIYQTDPTSLIGRKIDDLFTPSDRLGAADFWQALTHGGKDGVDVLMSLRLGEADHYTRLRLRRREPWCLVFIDLAGKSGEILYDLVLNREWWRAVVRDAADGIAVLDSDGRLLEHNPRLLELLAPRSSHGVAISEDSIRGKRLFEYLRSGSFAPIEAALAFLRPRDRRFSGRVVHENKHLHVELQPVLVAGRGYTGCSLVVRDLSAEEDLKNTRMRLLEAQKEALEAEMRAARVLQEAIIPGREMIRQYRTTIVGYLEPATHVGGDFWTCFSLPENKSLVFVGDVTGHGVSAGMVATIARACADISVRKLGRAAPDSFLSLLSDTIFEITHGQVGMTGLACLIDPDARTLTYSSAGHVPPILIERDPAIHQTLSMRGHVLGMSPGLHFESRQRTYRAGDRLLILTDGLIECTNKDRVEFGMRRLRQSLSLHAGDPLPRFLAALVADAAAFFGDEPRADDVTVVVVELE